MTGEVQTSSDSIQLHFCQRCGISIPQVDVDTGRANAAPGGYICAGCSYETRETAAGGLTGSRSTGSRALATLALLYVVGASTFLLIREINRKPPVLEIGDVATSREIDELARKMDGIDDQTRGALTDLKSNDDQQRRDLATLSERVNTVRADTLRGSENLRTDIRDLQATVTEIARRTGLLTTDVATVLKELRGLEDRVSDQGDSRGPTMKDGPKKRDPAKPARTREELERERLVNEYVSKLRDKKASDQTRYNAAVQLGDLQHPDAVTALTEALQNDSYDLVRRAAAWSLGMLGKHAVRAIPVLIRQIGGKEEYVGYMCERGLGEITKAVMGSAVSFNFDPTMSLKERRKVQKKWEEWWNKHKSELLPDGP